ncbi:MAG: DUF885 family protein [Xanthomonadales bacterium]|nr:DUF885 family protein [Xanthomonadales bacterium]
MIKRCFLLVLVLAGAAAEGEPGPPSGQGSYQDLVQLAQEFNAYRETDPGGRLSENEKGQAIEPVVDYSDEALARRGKAMAAFQSRIDQMNVAGWPRHQQVDWLALRSRLDQQQFILDRFQPWSRDPGFYVDPMQRITFTDLPVSGEDKERLLNRLRAVPVMIRQARSRLDNVAADYADLAIHNLSNADGVGHGHPYRARPPAGVLGWYEDLQRRAEDAQPELLPDIVAASNAIAGFDQWLKQNRESWTVRGGVGRDAFAWYLRQVKLMPWTPEELVTLGQRELDRLWAVYALERHRNRDLPELEPAGSAEDYQARIDATDQHVRTFLEEQDIITVPGDVGKLDTNAPWIVRPGGRNFWEEVQFRNPHPDHVHAVIPGHRFDILMARKSDHPVRSHIYSGARVEGWATYLEEAMLQAGMFEEMPRVRELIYIFGIFRAARVPADVWLQTGEMSVREVVDYWLPRVPYLDENVARVDAEIYLRRPPGYGIGYTIGTLQMQRLLADVRRLRGDRFNLRQFHDDIMNAGLLPLSLLRWEMTGLDDEIKQFWVRHPMPE